MSHECDEIILCAACDTEHKCGPCPTERYDTVSAIIEYENGTLGYEEIIRLFQHLVDSGLAWSLQGHYGRQAQTLIDAGLVDGPNAGK